MSVSASTLGVQTGRSRVQSHLTAPVLILLAIGLLAVALAFAVSLPVPNAVGVASDLRITADLVDRHADAMTADANQLAVPARATTGANRDLWIATAQHMASDAASLQAMAQRLRASAAILGDEPTYRANANPVSLSAQASLLRADGQAAVDHGRLMVDQAAFMTVIAAKPGSTITTQDAALMASDATRILDAGQRTLALTARLETGADQLRRGLGR
ncbi:MAG TPA: hypothetical protein VF858_00885 [Gemmatimonadaceae bacterium]